jgi:Flp pilus assembly protein TadD
MTGSRAASKPAQFLTNPMLIENLPARLLAVLAALCIPFGAPAQSGADGDDDEPSGQEQPLEAVPAPPREPLPSVELTDDILHSILIGEVAAQRGNIGIAAQTFLDLARRTRDPRIARRAVEFASNARMQNLAIEAARIWRDADSTSTQALQLLAGLLVAARRVEEAEPYLAQLFALSGNVASNGFMQLQRLLASNPDRQANLRVVQRLAARHDQLAQAQFAVAQAALGAGDEAVSLQAVRRAAALQPDWELAAIFEAQILQRRSPGEAARRLAEFVAKNPKAREARLQYARALIADKKIPDAHREFDSLLAENPDNQDVIQAVGLLAVQVKDYPTAERNMKRLLELGPRDANAVRLVLGQIAEEQKRWPDAIEWYRQITRGAQALTARLRTGNALAKQGKLDEARAYLQAVSATDPQQQVQLLVTEAQLLREANRVREAFDLLGKALERNPEQADLLYDLAITAEKLERFDLLESNLKKLIQLRPDNAHAYNALGYSFADRNLRLDEARKLIEKALEIAPDDYFIIDSLGWVLYRQGDVKGALEQLQRAYEGRPDAEIGAHLGEVLWVSGRRDEARRIWDESLKAAPDNETLQKTIKRFNP